MFFYNDKSQGSLTNDCNPEELISPKAKFYTQLTRIISSLILWTITKIEHIN